MESLLPAILGAVLGAVANRLRGTINYLVWVPAALLAGSVWWFSGSWLAAIVVALAYVLGESFGWTKWINCIPNNMSQVSYNRKWLTDDTGKKDGSYWIAQAIANERSDYKTHCLVGMIVRGIYWWAPVFAALWWFGLASAPVAIGAVGVLAFAFPQAYRLGYKYQFMGRYLRSAEVIYGAIYGAVLGIVIGI